MLDLKWLDVFTRYVFLVAIFLGRVLERLGDHSDPVKVVLCSLKYTSYAVLCFR